MRLLLILALGLVAASVGRHGRLSRMERAESEEPLSLPPSEVVRVASLGYQLLAADFFWLAAIQYYGTSAHKESGYRDLHRLLDLVTDLDPRFSFAYRFGGIAIPYHSTDRGWLHTDKAERLLAKGEKHCPESWQLGMLLGFIRLWHFNDMTGAAEAVEKAARQTGRPAYLPLLATRLRAHSGRADLGLAYVRSLIQETEEPELRKDLEEREKVLRWELGLKQLENAVEDFRKKVGAPPSSVEQLWEEGFLPGRPETLGDATLFYDPGTGKVAVNELTRRLVVPPEAMEAAARERLEREQAP
jgi:hypothetical protein